MEIDLEIERIQYERESEAHPDPRCGHLFDNGDCLFLGRKCLHTTIESIESCDYWEYGYGGNSE